MQSDTNSSFSDRIRVTNYRVAESPSSFSYVRFFTIEERSGYFGHVAQTICTNFNF